MSVAALAAGKHVSLQKPMARNLAEADGIVRAAAAADRVFRVLENYRYYPPYVRAKEILDSGEIGEPVTLRMKGDRRKPAGRLARAGAELGVAVQRGVERRRFVDV